jgi:hypothetical protein
MHVVWHAYDMASLKSESPKDVEGWLQSQASGLWPAATGSLSLRRASCIRENCKACLSGEGHPSYVLYTRVNGRRVGVHVPEDLVEEVRRCLDNGRALQDLLQEAAPRYLKALKLKRAKALKDEER